MKSFPLDQLNCPIIFIIPERTDTFINTLSYYRQLIIFVLSHYRICTSKISCTLLHEINDFWVYNFLVKFYL